MCQHQKKTWRITINNKHTNWGKPQTVYFHISSVVYSIHTYTKVVGLHKYIIFFIYPKPALLFKQYWSTYTHTPQQYSLVFTICVTLLYPLSSSPVPKKNGIYICMRVTMLPPLYYDGKGKGTGKSDDRNRLPLPDTSTSGRQSTHIYVIDI